MAAWVRTAEWGCGRLLGICERFPDSCPVAVIIGGGWDTVTVNLAGYVGQSGPIRSINRQRRTFLVPASAPVLLHLDRDLQAGSIPDVPFLNVETADDGGFALDLNLGELHRVLGVFLFLELNGFGFLFHDLILVDGFRLIDIFLAQVFSQPADTLDEDWHGVKPLAKEVVASNHRAVSENSGGHFFVIPQSSVDCGVCFAGDIQVS